MNKIFFCLKKSNSVGNPYYLGFKTDKMSLKTYSTSLDDKIYIMRVHILKEASRNCYYAWLDNMDRELYHIFPTKNMVASCFNHNYKRMEEMETGKLIYLSISEIISYKNFDRCPDSIKDLPEFILKGEL